TPLAMTPPVPAVIAIAVAFAYPSRPTAGMASIQQRDAPAASPPQIFGSIFLGSFTPTIYAPARAVASEYSWFKPPKIDLIRTSVSAANRCRDLDLGTPTDSFGGSGTPGTQRTVRTFLVVMSRPLSQ